MTARPAFSSVADYLSALDASRRKALKSVLGVVRKAVPDAAPVIRYGIPAFRRGRVFLYCAAFKRHIGLYPPVKADAALRRALKPYANAKGNLAFPLDEPLPSALVARVAKALAKQYAGPDDARASTTTPRKKRSRP